jgi:hypothetical protein
MDGSVQEPPLRYGQPPSAFCFFNKKLNMVTCGFGFGLKAWADAFYKLLTQPTPALFLRALRQLPASAPALQQHHQRNSRAQPNCALQGKIHFLFLLIEPA